MSRVLLAAALLVAGGLLGVAAMEGRGGECPESPKRFEDPKVELGWLLFHERRLSRSGMHSCASCHDPAYAYTDRRRVSIGLADLEVAHSPTLANAANRKHLFRDGRVESLEEQARGAILNRGELGLLNPELAVDRIQRIAGYGTLFESAFGTDEVTLDRITAAIAAFERTIVSRDSSFDRFLAGTESLSQLARLGYALFEEKGCRQCHAGPDFTDDEFHNVGTAVKEDFRASVTHKAEDKGRIRTPSLREVARTAPYFWDGSQQTLRGVLLHYESLVPGAAGVDPRITDLELTETEREALIAFLKCLSGNGWVVPPPTALPR